MSIKVESLDGETSYDFDSHYEWINPTTIFVNVTAYSIYGQE